MKMDFKDTLPDKGSENTVIVSILQDMGLTENEARVYMLLAQQGRPYCTGSAQEPFPPPASALQHNFIAGA
jgi:Sugar-specific transcriptional regulator TrmB.